MGNYVSLSARRPGRECFRRRSLPHYTYTEENICSNAPDPRQRTGPDELPRVGKSKRNTYVRYYVIAQKAGIRVSVRVVSDDKVRVTRKA